MTKIEKVYWGIATERPVTLKGISTHYAKFGKVHLALLSKGDVEVEGCSGPLLFCKEVDAMEACLAHPGPFPQTGETPIKLKVTIEEA